MNCTFNAFKGYAIQFTGHIAKKTNSGTRRCRFDGLQDLAVEGDPPHTRQFKT